MKLATLLRELQARGHWLEVQGSKLRCHGPERPAAEIAAAIREHLEALLRQYGKTPVPALEGREDLTGQRVADGLGEADHGWIEIDGVLYSPAAADLYQRSVPFASEASSARCMGCSGTRFWRLRGCCPWVCSRCHPSDRAENEVEWREGAGISLGSDPTPSRPSAPAALTFNPEVPHE